MKKYIAPIFILIYTLCSIYFYIESKIKEDTIYFIYGYHKNLFGDDKKVFFNLANVIEEKGYKVIETNSFKNLKNAKKIVVFDIHKKKIRKIKKLSHNKLILFTWEPPAVIKENHDKKYLSYFSKVYTFNDDLIDNKKYFKFYYPDAKDMIASNIDFKDKKFCTQIISNKTSDHISEIYTERKKAIRFFEEHAIADFDLFGQGWNANEFISYKGSIANKIDVLKNYKFSICFENSKNIKGYITEKIFDCFHAKVIPIYLGADNITDYIPKNCFIDKRDFKSYPELFIYLKTMSNEDYLTYIQNIKKFLNSEKAKAFTGKNLVETFIKALDI
ncbi:MAG: hypothetical protein KR126chlam6_00307 [Candidatus Anoxychlamydiales bacterium]|nr:hypothetical protein [Candidatus Anoxychlamydiales bacterium]